MKLGLLFLYVDDFPRILAPYRDVLDLEAADVHPSRPYARHPPGPAPRSPVGRSSRSATRASERSRALPLPRTNGVVVTFEVEDVDAAVERLRGRCQAPRIHRAEWGAAAHLFDPEGNELQVFRGS